MAEARLTGQASPPGDGPSNIVIILPAFNEGAVIGQVIRELRDTCDYAVVVVDDASTDDTIDEAVDAGATVLPLCSQLGAWGATQTGLRYALRKGYDMAICMDADGQHRPSSLEDLLRPVSLGVADVSIGTCPERGSVLRKIAWSLMRRASGLTLEDITSGFRVYNRLAIRRLASWRASMLDYQDVGVLLFLQSHGLKIVDVPAQMRARDNGASRIFRSWTIVAYYMCHTLLLGVSKRNLVRTYESPRMAD
jgi:glycosyltransferase involved in cell wall biosynthesis